MNKGFGIKQFTEIMVFGSIINWVVGRTLDFTLDGILWVTKTTGQGIVNLGYYVTSRNTPKEIIKDEKEQLLELIPLTKAEIIMLKEQNNILKEELALLKKFNPALATTFSRDLAEDLEKPINKESNIDSFINQNNSENTKEKENETVNVNESVKEKEKLNHVSYDDDDSDSFV